MEGRMGIVEKIVRELHGNIKELTIAMGAVKDSMVGDCYDKK